MGGGFPVESEGKVECGGEGGGWGGGDRQRNRQVNAHAVVKTTLEHSTLYFRANRGEDGEAELMLARRESMYWG